MERIDFRLAVVMAITGVACAASPASDPSPPGATGDVSGSSDAPSGAGGPSFSGGGASSCSRDADCPKGSTCVVTRKGELASSACVAVDAGPPSASDAGAPPPPPTPVDASTACAATMDQACDKGTDQEVAGCDDPAHYGCAAFEGIYYDSPQGCDPATAGSWMEYSFDGTHELYSGKNTAGDVGTGEIVGGASSSQHCTYVGFSPNDAFHNVPDGTCQNSSAAGYGAPNTWTKIIPGTGCTHMLHVPVSGTITCDGSCG